MHHLRISQHDDYNKMSSYPLHIGSGLACLLLINTDMT